MATLALTNAELYAEIGRMLGIGRLYAGWDTTTQADVDRIVRSGRRRFFSANNWKFLKSDLPIAILAPVDTGTVTIVAGVVTFAGGPTVPTDSATNWMFAPQGGGLYSIASYDSATQITLNDTSLAAAALSTYDLYKIKYDLPAAFGGWEGPITLENYNNGQLNESRNFPDYVLRSFANQQNVRTGKPELYSVINTTDAETAISTYQLQIYPLPAQAHTIHTRYKINAGDTLDAAESAISADPIFTECYKESILAAGEVIAWGQPGSHTGRFQQLLGEAIRQDNAMAGIRYGRPRANSRGRSRYYDLIVGTVDMSGQEP